MTSAQLTLLVNAQINTQRELQALRKDLQALDKDAEKLGGRFGRVSDTVAGFLGANAIQSGFRKLTSDIGGATRSASDLNESINAVNVVFENSAQVILDWGQNAARQAGLSQRAFNQLATPLGAMLKNAGFSMDEVAAKTIELTKRASDMASVFNTTVPDALSAIQAALRGEIDPIERYGVSLNAAAVEARALADTGKESAGALTAQEKAAARLTLILEQTAAVEGDFINTAGEAANQQRILAAERENDAAKIASKWLPLQKQVQSALLAMPAPLRIATQQTAQFAPEMLTLAGAFGQAALAAKSFGPALASSLPTMARFGLAGAAVAGSILLITQASGDSGPKIKDTVTSYEQLAVVQERLAKAELPAFARKEFARQVEDASRALDAQSKTQAEVARKQQETATAAEAAARKTGDFNQRIKDTTESAKNFNRSLTDASAALAGFGQVKTPELVRVDGQLADINKRIAEQKVLLDDAERSGKTYTQTTVEGSREIARANIEVSKSLDALNKARDEFAKDPTRENARDLRERELDYADALDTRKQAQQDATVTVNASADAIRQEIERLNAARDAISNQRDALIANRDAAIAMADSHIGLAQSANGLIQPESALIEKIHAEAAAYQEAARQAAELNRQRAEFLSSGPGEQSSFGPNFSLTPDFKPHAQGLPYVPYDNYPAYLHKGERVLTADEARFYRMLSTLTATGYAGPQMQLVADLKDFAAKLNIAERVVDDVIERNRSNSRKSRSSPYNSYSRLGGGSAGGGSGRQIVAGRSIKNYGTINITTPRPAFDGMFQRIAG